MLDLTDVLNVNFVASSATKAYSQPNDLTEKANNGDITDDTDLDIASSLIQNLIRGEIVDRRQAAGNAGNAISMLQIFEEALVTISEKLAQMAELAKESAGSSRTYTVAEKATMQKTFDELAGEINTIVDSTQSDGNNLLSASGQTILVSVGNGSVIQIYANDLSIDVDVLDLSISPGGAGLLTVEAWIEQTSSYREYLAAKTEQLEVVRTAIDFDTGDPTNVASTFDKISAMDTATEIVNEIINETTVLVAVQASVTPEMALQLLAE